ncbi:MAG: hypothetical protein ABI588_09685 [Arenimonas sp.]
MKLPITILALALALASTAASACDEHGMKDMEHGGMHMTAEQMMKKQNEMFAALDADKNGSISRAEFDRYHAGMMSKHMQHEQAEEAKEGHEQVETHK